MCVRLLLSSTRHPELFGHWSKHRGGRHESLIRQALLGYIEQAAAGGFMWSPKELATEEPGDETLVRLFCQRKDYPATLGLLRKVHGQNVAVLMASAAYHGYRAYDGMVRMDMSQEAGEVRESAPGESEERIRTPTPVPTDDGATVSEPEAEETEPDDMFAYLDMGVAVLADED